MDRKEIVLAALAGSNGEWFTPVQVQKLLFVMDRELADRIGGPYFEFAPYDYGPFDAAVYSTLEGLCLEGLVEIEYSPNTRWSKYRLTLAGVEKGRCALETMPQEVCNFVRSLSEWVRSLSFAELVSAIYRRYPDMKAKSIFRG